MLCDTYTNFLISDNSLFSSGHDSDSEERKENGTPAVRTHVAPKQTPTGGAAAAGGKGLFDDDEEEDNDFFGGKSPKKPDSSKSAEIRVKVLHSCHLVVTVFYFNFSPVVQQKPKPKTHIDLFDDEDEDGDIFSGSASTSTQSKKEVVEKMDKPPEKKANNNLSFLLLIALKNSSELFILLFICFFLCSCINIFLSLDATWGYFHIWSCD